MVLAGPYCVSHRALGYGEIENSLSALEAAGIAGAAGIEFDLHHTKDNKTIIYHDKKLKRLVKGKDCPVGKDVHELNLSDINGKCFLENGEPIPLFEDSLKLMRTYESILFVELKDFITDSDFDLIKKYYGDRPERLMLISFSMEALEVVLEKRKKDPFFDKIKLILLKKYGYTGNIDKIDGIDAKYIHKKRVKRLKKASKLVGVYTKDSEKKIKKYLKKGADFITTNKPTLCERIISENN
ncbi:MAG: glycerophosphoryl diester phosphodiesterase [Bacteriovoracaceae bacterium]|jgi:glycerophosphoryl diester phosphodiesterase